MPGAYQRRNFAVAAAAAEAALGELDPELTRAVAEGLELPGRVELLDGRPAAGPRCRPQPGRRPGARRGAAGGRRGAGRRLRRDPRRQGRGGRPRGARAAAREAGCDRDPGRAAGAGRAAGGRALGLAAGRAGGGGRARPDGGDRRADAALRALARMRAGGVAWCSSPVRTTCFVRMNRSARSELLHMMGLVAAVVAIVILVFFGLGYLFGRLFLWRGVGKPSKPGFVPLVTKYTHPLLMPDFMLVALFGITNDALNLVVNLVLLFLVVLWIALVAWTYFDARRRIEDPVLVACATAASLFPFVGTIVYSILRPPEFLADSPRARARDPRVGAPRQAARGARSCPNCEHPIERTFLRCPNCRARIKDPCESCGKPIDPRWSICPYCETPQRRAAPPGAPSPPAGLPSLSWPPLAAPRQARAAAEGPPQARPAEPLRPAAPGGPPRLGRRPRQPPPPASAPSPGRRPPPLRPAAAGPGDERARPAPRERRQLSSRGDAATSAASQRPEVTQASRAVRAESKSRTLILIKPDAFERGLTGEVLARFERKGLRITELQLLQATRRSRTATTTSTPRSRSSASWSRSSPGDRWSPRCSRATRPWPPPGS